MIVISESLVRHALGTVHRDSARMCGELDNVRRSTDLALGLADDATLSPARLGLLPHRRVIDRTPMSLPAMRPSLAGAGRRCQYRVLHVRLLSYRADVCRCSIHRVHWHLLESYACFLATPMRF